MLAKDERKIFHFIKNLPRNYFLLFWIGIGIYALKYIVNYLLPLQQKRFLDGALELKFLWTDDFYILLVLFGSSVLLLLAEYISFRTLRVRLGKYLYKLCINRIMKLPKQVISSKGTGYYNSIIVNLTQSLSTLISPTLFDFFFSVIQMIFINIIVYQWHKGVFLVFCIAYIFAAINTFIFHKVRKKYLDIFHETSADLSSETLNVISNTFTIRSFNVLSFFTKPLWKKLGENRSYLNSFLKSLEINRFVFTFIKTSAFAVMIILVLQSIFDNKMSYGQLLALIAYFESIFMPFHNYVTFLGDMVGYGSWVTKFEEAFLNMKKDSDNPKWIQETINTLSFKDVIIPYKKDVLPLSFELKNRIGLVGLSGEGKTSVLKILYREIIPDKGNILLNSNISYDSLPLLHYYERINILSQEVEIFNKDLDFNLLLGRNLIPLAKTKNEKKNLSKIIENMENLNETYFENIPDVLKPMVISYGIVDESGKLKKDLWKKFIVYKSNIHEQLTEELFWLNFVIEEDYNKVLDDLGLKKLEGRNFGEDGTFVSGGEKQRIAFGRFLLKKNFDFFIIDEPFSSLDAINEGKAISLVKEKVKDKKGFVITHKFYVLEKLADYFLVIDDGVITEKGNLTQLINKNGLFKELREEFYKNVNK